MYLKQVLNKQLRLSNNIIMKNIRLLLIPITASQNCTSAKFMEIIYSNTFFLMNRKLTDLINLETWD